MGFLYIIFSFISYEIIEDHIFFLFFFLTIQAAVYLLVPHKIISPNEVPILAFYSEASAKHLPKSSSSSVLKSYVNCMYSSILFSYIFAVCISNLNQKQSTVPVKIPGVLWSACLYPEQSWQLRTAVMLHVILLQYSWQKLEVWHKTWFYFSPSDLIQVANLLGELILF